jgi:hypothetical protein
MDVKSDAIVHRKYPVWNASEDGIDRGELARFRKALAHDDEIMRLARGMVSIGLCEGLYGLKALGKSREINDGNL